MNLFGLNYDEDAQKLEKYVYDAIRKNTAARDSSGAYVFKIEALPVTLPSNSILLSKSCSNLEEALEFRLLMSGSPRDEDYEESDASVSVKIVDDNLFVNI
ncbi:hypothetical protein IKG13_03105 [Candidatus Saccharibacteria bacterium]|nr:hypothetical protein [Candidatus Saccharibacteria bacterium]MBR3377814.1 hypothetical protein [Candidatus Saccharibacteria bacterium]